MSSASDGCARRVWNASNCRIVSATVSLPSCQAAGYPMRAPRRLNSRRSTDRWQRFSSAQ
jgi:hypothetical protein